jgi:glycosyltransferase involved in cell wall biosynthesis
MRIGIDAAFACGKRTGTGNYTHDLIRSVIEAPSSHEFMLYYRACCIVGNPLFQIKDSRVKHRVVPSRSTLWRILFRLGPAAQEDGVDLLLSPAYFLPGFAGSALRVATFYDLNVFCLARQWIRRGRIKDFLCLRLLLPIAARRADHIVVISEATRKDLEAYFPTTRGRNTMIYPGVAPERFAQGPSSDTLSTLPHSLYFLYVGVMSPTKNLERLIQAFALFRKRERRPFKLIMAGRECGCYRAQKLKPLVRQLHLDDQVEFLDFVSEERLKGLYQGARAVVYPSLGEGFGYPIVEAMLAGAPVLTSTVSSCAEVAGAAGVCVDPYSVDAIADAMEELAVNDRRWAELRSAGYQRAREFSLQVMAQSYLKLFEHLAGDRMKRLAR